MKADNFIIYQHIFPNGKVYIGITSRSTAQRFQNGQGYRNNRYMCRAIKKYGWENVRSKVITSGLSRQKACELEIEVIHKTKSTNPKHGYNICHGGEVNIPNEEVRKKISDAMKGNTIWLGRKHRPESIAKLKDREVSEQARAKMRKSWRKRREKGTPEDTRRKMSEVHKGVPKSDEHKRKLSISNKQSHKHEQKAVLAYKGNQEMHFISVRAAAIGLLVDRASVSRCCNGKQKTAGGWTIRFEEE